MKMGILQIMNIVRELPLREKIHIIELIFKEIKEETVNSQNEEEKRRKAAQLLLSDYQNDQELTAFSALDKEDFYEPK